MMTDAEYEMVEREHGEVVGLVARVLYGTSARDGMGAEHEDEMRGIAARVVDALVRGGWMEGK